VLTSFYCSTGKQPDGRATERLLSGVKQALQIRPVMSAFDEPK
jgi:hypothetical protein